jgi:hypothetical protein
MLRSLLTIMIVAAISGWISAGERAVGRSTGNDWVRTADGWEPRIVLEPREPLTPPPIHPGIIAALQVSVSLMFLMAFPSRVRELAIERTAWYGAERRQGSDRRQGIDRRAA